MITFILTFITPIAMSQNTAGQNTELISNETTLTLQDVWQNLSQKLKPLHHEDVLINQAAIEH